MREPTIALLKHSKGLLKGLTDVGAKRSEEKHSPSEGTARKTLLKCSEKTLYATARAGTEKQRRRTERERSGTEKQRRYLGGFSE
jgi:hypothetical protein